MCVCFLFLLVGLCCKEEGAVRALDTPRNKGACPAKYREVSVKNGCLKLSINLYYGRLGEPAILISRLGLQKTS